MLPVLIWFHFRPSIRRADYLSSCDWVDLSDSYGWLDEACQFLWHDYRYFFALYHLGWFLVARVWYARFNIGEFSLGFWSLPDSLPFGFQLNGQELCLPLVFLGVPCPQRNGNGPFSYLVYKPLFLPVHGPFFLFGILQSVCWFIHSSFIDQEAYCIRVLNRSICPELYLGLLLMFLLVYPFFSSLTRPKKKT